MIEWLYHTIEWFDHSKIKIVFIFQAGGVKSCFMEGYLERETDNLMDVPHFVARIGVVAQIAIQILANPVCLGLGEDRLSPGLFHLPYTLGFSVRIQ